MGSVSVAAFTNADMKVRIEKAIRMRNMPRNGAMWLPYAPRAARARRLRFRR